ncbi:hypothetical protein ZWY2020_013210 [Hordeum vulgare]|nr:hypothetical protein ZWY2020_013210 [Hordeum vulgare]
MYAVVRVRAAPGRSWPSVPEQTRAIRQRVALVACVRACFLPPGSVSRLRSPGGARNPLVPGTSLYMNATWEAAKEPKHQQQQQRTVPRQSPSARARSLARSGLSSRFGARGTLMGVE